MGSLFRSEDMHLLELVIPLEAAHDSLFELGMLDSNLIEFEDLNKHINTFQRTYVDEVRRCDDMQRLLRFFRTEVDRAGLEVPIFKADESYGTYRHLMAQNVTERLDSLDERFRQIEEDLREQLANELTLSKSEFQLTELRHVLNHAAGFFDEAATDGGVVFAERAAFDGAGEDDASKPLMGGASASTGVNAGSTRAAERAIQLGFVAGVVPVAKQALFERLLWRATRGNVFMRLQDIGVDIYDPEEDVDVRKSVFVIFFQGESIKYKITKTCESLGATLYPIRESRAERDELAAGVDQRLAELDTTLNAGFEAKRRMLQGVANDLGMWTEIVDNEKAIFNEMNKFKTDVSAKALVAQGWAPIDADDQIREALERGGVRSGAAVGSAVYTKHTDRDPPTYFRTNKYTKGFQAIVDTYGMATYKEINPGGFAVITFPFIFGVMFGDLGHGSILTLFGLFLILMENKIARMQIPEMARTLVQGRYVIFLMGCFATYTGVIYNDCFSLSFDWFGTNIVYNETTGVGSYIDPNRTYPFGVDPGWAGSTNKLMWYNPFKMKLSIIVGVAQMTFGVTLSAFNFVHRRKWVDVFFTFIPQMLFLMSMFGWLVLTIILKWCTFFTDGANPPQLLQTLINAILKFGTPPPDNELLFGSQGTVQTILIIIMVLSMPMMFFPKLIIIKCKKNARAKATASDLSHERAALLGPSGATESSFNDRGMVPEGVEFSDSSAESGAGGGHASAAHGGAHGDEEEEHHGPHDELDEPMAELVVHQVIHTIEYILGTVSNTASYLRLWALSLAHAQLSEVFWDQLLFSNGIATRKWYMIFFTFSAWCTATVGVLLIMECLSAFLHALRLHWVEWMNKFYQGTGRKFIPFRLEDSRRVPTI